MNLQERLDIAENINFTRDTVFTNAAGTPVTTVPAGTHIDITVAAIGDAANLQGGILVLTSLRGADGQVYAVAQGPVVTGGFSGVGAALVEVLAELGAAHITVLDVKEPTGSAHQFIRTDLSDRD